MSETYRDDALRSDKVLFSFRRDQLQEGRMSVIKNTQATTYGKKEKVTLFTDAHLRGSFVK